jgi:hypothetical protein
MTTVAEILSTPADNLWTFETADGRGLRRAMEYMVPFIRNKKSWPKPPDVMYDAEWPMRHPSLLSGLALNKPDYLALWSTLPGLERGRGDSEFLRPPARPLIDTRM